MALQVILLAAGSSQRFTGNKLLRPLPSSQCLLDLAYQSATRLSEQILVIISHDPALVRYCQQKHYPYLINPKADNGMASSLVAGVTASADAEAWAIFLADMPGIQPTTLQQLAGLWRQHAICLPAYGNKPGHPVIFSRKYYNALTSLNGDHGARRLLNNNPEVFVLETDDAGVCFDIDTDAAWNAWAQNQSN